MKQIITFILTFLFFNVYSQQPNFPQFRGIWVSTVKMLDYPSQKGLSADNLKDQYIQILATCEHLNLNAIVFQIRPAADAFYASNYEPWSEWLTGKQGRAPHPYYDPLQFMIEQSHLHQIQFHAWINPFRAIATIQYANITDNQITKTKPEWFFDYGKNRYFNPGIPVVQDYIIKVIADIVRRYDIDGIHFDDYFYPYPEKDENGKIIPIPDEDTYRKYGKKFSNIKDWRRDNINRFVHSVYDTIKAIKPNVVFGISPCAVWRNKDYDPQGSETRGLASYDWLYADVLFWLKNKWVDYIAPQIYTGFGNKYVDYATILKWWTIHNYNVPIFVGLNIEGVNGKQNGTLWSNPNQIPRQIRLAMSYPQVTGFILYRYKSVIKNELGVTDSLQKFFVDTTQILIAKNNDTIKIDTFTKTIAKNNIKPEFLPSAPIDVSKYFVGNELIIMWITVDHPDSVKLFTVYKSEFDKKQNKDTLIEITSTTNNYVSLKTKRFFIFNKTIKFFVTEKGYNKTESTLSEPIYAKLINFSL